MHLSLTSKLGYLSFEIFNNNYVLFLGATFYLSSVDMVRGNQYKKRIGKSLHKIIHEFNKNR